MNGIIVLILKCFLINKAILQYNTIRVCSILCLTILKFSTISIRKIEQFQTISWNIFVKVNAKCVLNLKHCIYYWILNKNSNNFNFIFLQILGILAIVYGVIVLNSIGVIEVDNQVGFPPQAAVPICLITIGSIVVFIAFLGCCGAIREDVCMTMCYAVFMLLLLILQLILVVLLWTNKDKITSVMGDVIDKAWERESREAGFFEAIQKSVSFVVIFLIL